MESSAHLCRGSLRQRTLTVLVQIRQVITEPPGQHDALTTVTDRPGYFTREEIVERYAARSGRDVSGIRYYEIFAVFKIAVVVQQIYYRYAQGQTTDPRFATFDARVEFLARHAAALAAG